jgi:hypothetical protein
MPVKKVVGALALGATLTAGGIAGTLLGVPGVSGASTPVESSVDATDVAGHGPGRGMKFGRLDLGVAAESLGMTEDELKTALEQEDTSIADVAASKDVDVQKVIDALVADATVRIDQAVTDEDLTAKQAEALEAELPDRVTAMVNGRGRGPGGEGGPGGQGGGPGMHGRGRGIDLGVAADALGLTEDELQTALEADDTTLADVAEAQGVDKQELIDALVADATADLDERVTAIVNGE